LRQPARTPAVTACALVVGITNHSVEVGLPVCQRSVDPGKGSVSSGVGLRPARQSSRDQLSEQFRTMKSRPQESIVDNGVTTRPAEMLRKCEIDLVDAGWGIDRKPGG